jgi:hypothetical protein
MIRAIAVRNAFSEIVTFYFGPIGEPKQPHLPASVAGVAPQTRAAPLEKLMTKLLAAIGIASTLIIVAAYAQDNSGTMQHKHHHHDDNSSSSGAPKN